MFLLLCANILWSERTEMTEVQPGFAGVLKLTSCPLMELVWSLESGPPEAHYI